ncbi:MAG: hypothetical protein AVO39_05580 [delta proteobacterium MLS_D]|jgi:hypothetical protein|nr:MAG: hypothetical protein AVO39_05580 [delta proteobacterium MLS_D]
MCARRRSRKKTYRLERLGEFLPATLMKQRIFIDTIPPNLTRLWTKTVGPQIARQTGPCRFRDGMLSVRVSTSSWMQQLQFMKDEILDRLNAADPQHTIKKIKFFIGHVPPPPVPVEKTAADIFDESRLKKRDRRLIAERTATVEDEELREIIRRAMVKEALTRHLRS